MRIHEALKWGFQVNRHEKRLIVFEIGINSIQRTK